MIQYIVYGFAHDYTPFCHVYNSEDRAYACRDRILARGWTVHITFQTQK